MTDTLVQVREYKHTFSTDGMGKLKPIVRVVITVGDYGPFAKDFPDDDNIIPAVQNWKAMKIAEVQTVTA